MDYKETACFISPTSILMLIKIFMNGKGDLRARQCGKKK